MSRGLSADDVTRHVTEIVKMAERLTAAKGSTEVVWEVYSQVEKTVAILKFKLDYETPGLSTKLPQASDPERLVEDAKTLMSRAVAELQSGEFELGLESLRRARNKLRSVLTPRRASRKRS